MKHKNQLQLPLLFSGLALLCALAQPATAQPVREIDSLIENVRDYTYSWWMHGLRDERKVLAVRTSRFAMAMDVPKLKLTHLNFSPQPASEADALAREG